MGLPVSSLRVLRVSCSWRPQPQMQSMTAMEQSWSWMAQGLSSIFACTHMCVTYCSLSQHMFPCLSVNVITLSLCSKVNCHSTVQKHVNCYTHQTCQHLWENCKDYETGQFREQFLRQKKAYSRCSKLRGIYSTFYWVFKVSTSIISIEHLHYLHTSNFEMSLYFLKNCVLVWAIPAMVMQVW